MVERRRRPRFLREALQTVAVRRERRGQNLDRNGAVQPRIVGTIHLAHTSCTQQRLDFVGAEFHARGECHECHVL